MISRSTKGSLGKYDLLDENAVDLKLIIVALKPRHGQVSHGHRVKVLVHLSVFASLHRSHFGARPNGRGMYMSRVCRVQPAN